MLLWVWVWVLLVKEVSIYIQIQKSIETVYIIIRSRIISVAMGVSIFGELIDCSIFQWFHECILYLFFGTFWLELGVYPHQLITCCSKKHDKVVQLLSSFKSMIFLLTQKSRKTSPWPRGMQTLRVGFPDKCLSLILDAKTGQLLYIIFNFIKW